MGNALMLITREPDRLRLTGYTQIEQIRHSPESRAKTGFHLAPDHGAGRIAWGLAGELNG